MTAKSRLIVRVVVGVSLLLLGYVGTYYAVVRPFAHESYVVPIYAPPWTNRPRSLLFHAVCDLAFHPFYELDRRIRPHVWEPTP